MKMRSIGFMAYVLAAVFTSHLFVACSDSNDPTPEPENGDPEVIIKDGYAYSEGLLFNNSTEIGNGYEHYIFTGKTTIKKGTYLLKGWVYVADGAELTIEPGTIIKGDKQTKAALIIEPGGKAIMQGTASESIVMTSAQPAGQRKPGDWGGLIICGKAKHNQGTANIEGGPKTIHGGDDDDDNSGIYQYIRVEFAGYPFQADQEINGITFGSVGRGTTVDHLQVSYSNDDSFEWFGGSVNCKYLIAYNGWDDEFDTDNGFSGHVQFCLSIRDPKIADQSQSNGFESDNCSDGAQVSPYTNSIFSNVTFIGPGTHKNRAAGYVNDADYINGGEMYPNNGSGLGKFQAAMQIRRSSQLACYNSVAIGYPIGLIIDGERGNSVGFAKDGTIKLQNIIFANMDVLGSDANKKYEDVLGVYENGTITYDETQESFSSTFFKSQTGNKYYEDEDDLLLTDKYNTGQNYIPQTGSPLLGAASFTGVNSTFLNTSVTYIGAFSGPDDTWMDGWTNFDPQNTVY
ncbi:MAG: hypothetical protein LUF85_07860 [Bacteroides sp.]|nr:hypothetical protein [Bacteroides sp.]